LAGVTDIGQQCLRCDAELRETGSGKSIVVQYLNQSYVISLPDIEVSLLVSEEPVGIRDKLLILHYFTLAKGTPITNKWLAYQELPGGLNYVPTFAKRAIAPIVEHFGGEPERLVDMAGKLGGYQADIGDVSVTINAFRRVPITLVLWRGDEEFPPQGSIMFDGTISEYLSTDDINVLCETIAWRLVRLLGGDSLGRN